MALIGNQLSSAENNSYRVLDNLASFTLTFDGSSSANVLASTDTIALSQHPFVTGQRVTYSSGGGSPIGGLLSGTAYYITKTDQNSFKLASSYVNAITNINIDLVGTGTGVTHSFNVAFDGVNTKFKATYSNGTKCTISRAPQLDIAINGVVQQPYDSNPPPNGFTIEADATIVFSTAPLAGYTFWGKALSGSIASVENSDNSIDNFTGNGSTTNFTLSKTPTNSQNVLVTINGVTQYPSDATGTRSYSTNANVLVFTAAPANGSLIQVRYIGFAGPTSSNVTGFYGRTGNVVLNSSDGIGVGTAKIGTGIVGLATALLVEGNVRITGILTIGTSSITLNGSTDTIVVGSSFIRNNSIGLGATTTTGRNAGVGTATGTIIYNSTTGLVEVYNGSSWQSTSDRYLQASGGIVTTYYSGGVLWAAHTFTSSGTFTVISAPPNNNTVEYLVVAGGGAGGGMPGNQTGGGGGGAGGFRNGIGVTVNAAPGSYTVTVGAGGATTPNSTTGGSGSPSWFGIVGVSTITSTGGGGGAPPTASNPGSANAGSGGSGGGGGAATSSPPTFRTGGSGNTPSTSPPQGNSGGYGGFDGSNLSAGGGGGGAGAAGANGGSGPGGVGGPGGNGLASAISGTSVTYAGGGGGGAYNIPSPSLSSGGSGGGGAGGRGGGPVGPDVSGTAGTTNTGGGGGSGATTAGSGGSGVVIIRYQVGQQSVKATGGTVSYVGGKTIHTFTSSSTFTITDPALTSVEYLVVGGGGAGGAFTSAGGGGAGGLRNSSSHPVNSSPGVYTITVGSGGAGSDTSSVVGANGSPSIFDTITSQGGGGGGSNSTANGTPGGSGGGGAGEFAGSAGNGSRVTGTSTPAPSQGNDGGAGGPGALRRGGGGGGAGGAGVAGPTSGNGGPGSAFTISGASITYAGGGGGAGEGQVSGSGGPGGGGNAGSQAPGSAGTVNLGAGGGGAGRGPSPAGGPFNGGNGGSGIVIISYPS